MTRYSNRRQQFVRLLADLDENEAAELHRRLMKMRNGGGYPEPSEKIVTADVLPEDDRFGTYTVDKPQR
ncbi:hypothetical protein EDC61_104104 [Sulfuritortus calidifontis]|uniref:Uncharacterized protein n=1 Tax=Sulfuritortus calidifontis TaxID=1914471 RepID=A0A4R3JWW1_9PROT|nr:hypothetical protein EDC61_104104 [Sulfuritortus calidifontis]